MSDIEEGDWFCPNCGYLSWVSVTFHETCRECDTPVVWHTAEQKDRIAELEAKVQELETAQRWIPVSERLPDDSDIGRLFLCYDAATEQQEIMLFDYNDGDYMWVSGWSIPNRPRPNITHWMHLPTPPEE